MALQKLIATPTLLICCVVLLGCPGLVPGSKMYQGLSADEEEHFKKANRELYPNDVRNNLQQYQSSKIAWPGLIVELKSTQKEGRLETKLLVEHHYYDWVLDYSIQWEKIFLSPRGEGPFATVCVSRPDASASKEFQSYVAVGNLLILYGTPEKVEEGIIFVTCEYPRFITKGWFRTDIFDYGRSGEPVYLKNVAGPGQGTVLQKIDPPKRLTPPETVPK